MPFSKLIVVLPCHGLEDFPIHLVGQDAESVLANWTALWHPALIGSSLQMPTWESVDFPSNQYQGALVLVPSVAQDRLAPSLEEARHSATTTIICGLNRRNKIHAHPIIATHLAGTKASAGIVRDFFSLGYAFLQIQLMTRQLRYSSSIDTEELARRVTEAAAQAVAGDQPLAVQCIESCFDLLLEEKTKYYPVQPQLLDLVLLAPSTLGPSLRRQLETPHRQNFLITGDLIAQLISTDPQTLEILRSKAQSGDAHFIGGLQHELRTSLVSIESMLRQFRQGHKSFENDLGRRPTMFARLSFGLSSQIPGLLRQLDYGGAYHVAFGDGKIPKSSNPTINWAGDDGSTIPALTAEPIDAGVADGFLALGVNIGQSLDSAHYASTVLVHWPNQTCDYFDDLQRTQKFGSLFGRFVTFEDYLESVYDPGYSETYTAEEYRNSYLSDDVNSERLDPISSNVKYWRIHFLGSSVQSLITLLSIWRMIDAKTAIGQLATVERALQELDRVHLDPRSFDQILLELEQIEDELIKIGPLSPTHSLDRVTDGMDAVFINPLSFNNRFCLQQKLDLPAKKSAPPIVIADRGKSQSHTIADIPAFGSIRIKSSPSIEADPLRSDPPVLDGMTLRNEYFELLVDEKTGGINSITRQNSRRTNILTQKLACRMSHPVDVHGYPMNRGRYSAMVADHIETAIESRVMARITSTGRLVEKLEEFSGSSATPSAAQTLADYKQTVSVTRCQRIVDIHIEIHPRVELNRKAWQSYICTRIAWSDESAEIFRSENETRHRVIEDRFCAPNFVDIVDSRGKITLLPRGLTYHKRSSRRILDTLLRVAGETQTHFQLGIAVDVPISICAATAYQSPYYFAALPREKIACNGWIFHLSCKNVIATSTAPRFDQAGRVSGATLRLQETQGHGGTLKITCPCQLTSAARVNFLHELQSELATDGATATCNFTPFQFFQIELYW